MARYSTQAVLLTVRNWGEADKMVTFFSKDLGKVTAAAYGCRRPRSALSGGMQVFSLLELQASEGANVDAIRQCQTINAFRQLRENLEYMAYASFIAELVLAFCPERHPEPEIYELLLAALGAISQRNPRLVALAAACQILEHTGSQPSYEACAHCGATAGPLCFSAANGGACCEACRGGEEAVLTDEVQAFFVWLRALDWKSPTPFRVSGATLVQAEKLLLGYLVFLNEKPLKSLAFIQQLALLPKETNAAVDKP